MPTIVAGGEWLVSYPAVCTLECHIEYLPDRADEPGRGLVEREFSDWIADAAAADPWLRAHPPRRLGLSAACPPAEVAEDDPIVQTLLAAATTSADPAARGPRQLARRGHAHRRGRHPGGLLRAGRRPPRPHGDEYVPIDDLVACAQRIALAAMRFCG